MKMRKIGLFAAMFAVCGAMLCLNSCEKDNGFDVLVDDARELNQTEPTADQLSVRVTADLPAAVLSNFDENSTGAALKRRLNVPSPAITDNTRLVLVEGSDMMKWDNATFDQVVAVVRNGGYLAIETLTGTEMEWFADRLVERQLVWEQAYIDDNYDISGGSQNAVSSSASRWQARAKTIRDMGTRAGAALDDSVVAELVAFSNVAYFYMDPFLTEVTLNTSSADEDDNVIESQTITAKQERTAFRAGQMADSAAEWFNLEEERDGEPATSPFATRSGGSSINEILSATEKFSYSGYVEFYSQDMVMCTRANRINYDVYSWGVNDLSTGTDYYYIESRILLRMGPVQYVPGDTEWKILYPCDQNEWYTATGYGEYNRWYGCFLTQFIDIMDLSGAGTVKLEEALPYTDNNSGSKAIIIGNSSGTSESVGGSFTGNFSANPGLNLGISYSYGWSESNSFSMNTQQTYKDLGVVKNTVGKQVKWTHKANKPTFYVETKNNKYYFCHTVVPDILVNDVDLTHEACWSVANASGPSRVDISADLQLGALLYVKNDKTEKEQKNKYFYNDTPTKKISHTLVEPNRARQTWRMEVVVEKKLPNAPYSARRDIENDLKTHFPNCFKEQFDVCDKTATSVEVIDAVINASKEIFDKNINSLRRYAEDVGVIQYTIHWRCDEQGISPKQGYTVY